MTASENLRLGAMRKLIAECPAPKVQFVWNAQDEVDETEAWIARALDALAGVRERDRIGSLDIGPCWCPDFQIETWSDDDDPEELNHHPVCRKARAILADADRLFGKFGNNTEKEER